MFSERNVLPSWSVELQERLKFLRLMGGQKFVDAATSMEPQMHPEQIRLGQHRPEQT